MHSMAAGLFLHRTYFIGYASYCYVHCIDLMLQNVSMYCMMILYTQQYLYFTLYTSHYTAISSTDRNPHAL